MWTRGTALLLGCLLALGGLLGYALGQALPVVAPADGDSTPVAAQPSVPGDPAVVIEPDPDNPPLPTELKLGRARLGEGRYLTEFPVPQGWVRTSDIANEAKWKMPDYPSNTYVLRVEQVLGQHETVDHILTSRISALEDTTWDFEIVEQTDNSLEFTYVSPTDRHFRHAFLVWLDVSDEGFAEMEIALTGREVDAPGMRALLERVVAGTRIVG